MTLTPIVSILYNFLGQIWNPNAELYNKIYKQQNTCFPIKSQKENIKTSVLTTRLPTVLTLHGMKVYGSQVLPKALTIIL